MNRYSRITTKSKSKSVAIDLCDHFSVAISEAPPIISKPNEEKCNKNDDKYINGEEGDGEMFGVILKRSRSVSSCKSMAEKERSRSNSVKRSSSVSSSSSSAAGGRGGGYCRIHHQSDYPISHEQIDNFNVLHKGNKFTKNFKYKLRKTVISSHYRANPKPGGGD